MVFENGVKNIQAAAYNGARTVCSSKSTVIYHCLCNKVKVNLLIGLIDVPYIHKSIPVYLSNLYLADASTFFVGGY